MIRSSVAENTPQRQYKEVNNDRAERKRARIDTGKAMEMLISLQHRFLLIELTLVLEKTSPRSDLRWKPTGRIFKSVGPLSGFLRKVHYEDINKENLRVIWLLKRQISQTIVKGGFTDDDTEK
ncbi:hypothetical protein Tco_0278662 [Tanacetum coccineum]